MHALHAEARATGRPAHLAARQDAILGPRADHAVAQEQHLPIAALQRERQLIAGRAAAQRAAHAQSLGVAVLESQELRLLAFEPQHIGVLGVGVIEQQIDFAGRQSRRGRHQRAAHAVVDVAGGADEVRGGILRPEARRRQAEQREHEAERCGATGDGHGHALSEPMRHET
jgi:hypothetical protein